MNSPQYDMTHDENKTGSYKTLQEALKLTKQAVQGEKEDEMFYDYLISVAPTKEEEAIITSIRNDERNHNKMFREIYEFYTGQEIQSDERVKFTEPKSYIEGVKKAFFGELSAMERYRIIRAGLPNTYYKDMVFEILTDELKHADKYNYILTKNSKEAEQDNTREMELSGMQQNQTTTTTKTENECSPDQLVTYITPFVDRAMREVKEGISLEHLFQKFIIYGILVGNGFTLDQAIDQFSQWEESGESKLLTESKKKK